MKNILIDTVLYNPTIYVYNVNMVRLTATLYNDITKKVKTVKIKNNKSGVYILDEGQYHHIPYMFDISE